MVEHAVGLRHTNVDSAVPAAGADGGEDNVHASILVVPVHNVRIQDVRTLL